MRKLSPALDWMGRLVSNHPRAWVKFGHFETSILAGELSQIAIEMPVYIAGLARAGSTLLLEILAAHPDVATHRYADFPFLFTPYWWHTSLSYSPLRDKRRSERAHGDRMLVNADSPEAMEEMLWMGFIPGLHDAQRNQIMQNAPPEFIGFYREHIRKLLLARKRPRYVSKGNYLATRMLALQSIFPDARFIIPIRSPETHIVSLMRQHARFSEAGRNDPRIVRHMNIAGHYEFGLNRIAINVGDARQREILDAWNTGAELRGWALYWDALYGFIHRQLAENPDLKPSALVIRFETLCKNPRETIAQLLDHAGLSQNEALAERFAGVIRMPDYYDSPLCAADKQLIRDITGATAAKFGY